MFCTFWLWNVLLATTACNFSSPLWPHGSAPAALASLLFDPPEPQITWKTQCFATFLPFRAPGSSFFGDFLFFDPHSSSLLFSYSSHLCFSSVNIVRSLTSKPPSNIQILLCSKETAPTKPRPPKTKVRLMASELRSSFLLAWIRSTCATQTLFKYVSSNTEICIAIFRNQTWTSF